MRFKIEFETGNEELPIDYRRKLISVLKGALEDYNEDLFKAIYGSGHSPKSFCFSTCFAPKVAFTKEKITLNSQRFHVMFTTLDVLTAVHLINAFMARRNKWIPFADCNNKLKVVAVAKIQERSISSNSVCFKILSPIVIRDHTREGKDWYLTFEDKNFEAIWKRNLTDELKIVLGKDVSKDISSLRVTPVQTKKTVVKSYGIYIPCTIGSMMFEGEKYLLEYLYKAGIGSKRSMGFGCLDIV